MNTLTQLNKNNLFVDSNSDRPTEIAILDPTIPDSDRIVAGIKPGTETYILNSQSDAIEQITAFLARHQGIQALHVISHGASGCIQLGNTQLNSQTLARYSQQIQQWRTSLAANATIIIYGCNVGAIEPKDVNSIDLLCETGVLTAGGPSDGRKEFDRNQFLDRLHQLTGANIAANLHSTGNSDKGGTWDIPQLIPRSSQKVKLAIVETTLKTYSGVLGLAPKVDFTIGIAPSSFPVSSEIFNGDGKIGDFNGDGKPDVVVANLHSDTVSILLNITPTGATTPIFATRAAFPTPRGPISVSVGDLNGDGKPDIATANLYYPSTASVLLNTTPTGATTPTFTTQVAFTTGLGPRSISMADFNSDGKPDLAAVSYDSDSVSVLFNTTPTGATTPTFAPLVSLATGSRPYFGSIGDFNADGKPDLAVGNLGSANVSILLNTTATGATTPSFAPQVPFPTGSGPWSVSIGDFNSDGKSDLAVSNVNDKNVSVLLNTTTTGATTPTFTPQVAFPTGLHPFSANIGDFNSDGKPDIAAVNADDNNLSILINTTVAGSTTPSFAPQVTFPAGTYPYFVNTTDINGDGKSDLSVTNFGSSIASILLNTTAKVTAVTATTPDGSYGVGATIAITVTFDSPVTVTGTPQLQLETGTTDRFANYASGSDTTALTFNYLVQPGDTSGDLEYLTTNALTLSGGTIKDNLTADADLTLPALGSAISLGGSKAIVIGQTIADNIPPTVALTSTSPATINSKFSVTATFSENVTGFDNTDITAANATVSNFVTVDPKTYTFDVTPSADGNVTVDLPEAKATDNAGNNNIAATQLIRTANLTPVIPTPTPVTPTPTPVTPTPTPVTPTPTPVTPIPTPVIPQPTDQNWPVPPTPPVNNQLPIVNKPIWDQSRATGFSSNTAFVFAPDTFIAANPGETITYTVTALDNNSVAEGQDYFWTQGANGGSYKRKTENASVTAIPTIFDGPNAWLKFDPTTRTLSQVPGTNLSLPQWVEVKATSSNGKSVSELLHLQGWSCTGFVIDDYISGANVFFDANKNGIADAIEPKGTTDGKGAYAFDIPLSSFDTNQNGKIDPNEGNLVAVGGTDIGTNLPLETPLKATPDATVITLLTSILAELADRSLTVNEANAKLTSSLNIPSDIAINHVDPIAATKGGQPGAKALLSAMLQVQNSLTQTAGLIDGASNLSMGDAVKLIVSAIADRILAGGTLDLTKPEQIAALTSKVVDKVRAIDPNFNAQEISIAAPAIAQVIAASNERIASAIANNTDTTELQKQIAAIQKIALGETTQDFKAFGAGQKTLDALVAENTSTALDAQILNGGNIPPNPNPNPSDSPIPNPSDSPTPNPSDSPTPNPSDSPTPNPSDSPTPNPSDSPTPTPAGAGTGAPPLQTATPTPAGAGTGAPPLQTATPTPTPTPTNTLTLAPTGEVQITITTPKPSVSSNVRSNLPENTRLGDVYLLTDGNDTSIPAAALGLSVFALSGNDSLTGLDFPNTYFGNQGEDTLVGEGGNDELIGGKGSDSIAGGSGNDFLSGNNDNDILLGGEGDDTLRGGKQDDILSGGAGNDVLNGDPGFDILTGGVGGDRFVLQDPATELSQADVILDFTASDKIQLIDVTFSQLTFESVSVILDSATAVASTAIKSGNNYLGVVYNVNPSALNSSSFV